METGKVSFANQETAQTASEAEYWNNAKFGSPQKIPETFWNTPGEHHLLSFLLVRSCLNFKKLKKI